MKDSELAVAAGAAVFALVIALLLTFSGIVSDRMKYQTFLRSQALVIACREERAPATRSKSLDEICGPVPKYEDFK